MKKVNNVYYTKLYNILNNNNKKYSAKWAPAVFSLLIVLFLMFFLHRKNDVESM